MWHRNLGDVIPLSIILLARGSCVFRDFADEYPSSEVIGVDLSPIQPASVPPNCRFVVDDVNEAWQYPDNKFDLIHIRAMTGSVSNWVDFHKKALQ